MKYTFLILINFGLGLISLGQTPEPSELRFKLYNEAGQLLTCDSLSEDTLFIIERGQFNSYMYDSETDFHKVSITAFGSNLSIRWIRNKKVMDLILNIYDTTSTIVDYYSFDQLRFEEGQYEIKVRTNTTPNCETFDVSRSKYYENLKITTENSVQHFTWESLVKFKTDLSNWCSVYYYPLDERTLKKVECP